MGLTKQYLRYVASAVFGVIGSPKANIAYVTIRGGEKGRFVAVAACEHVFIWDVRKAEKVGIPACGTCVVMHDSNRCQAVQHQLPLACILDLGDVWVNPLKYARFSLP